MFTKTALQLTDVRIEKTKSTGSQSPSLSVKLRRFLWIGTEAQLARRWVGMGFVLLLGISATLARLEAGDLITDCSRCNNGKCRPCSGTGFRGDSCGSCNGTGMVNDSNGNKTKTCSACRGDRKQRCAHCNGRGDCFSCGGTGKLIGGRHPLSARNSGSTASSGSTLPTGNIRRFCSNCGGRGTWRIALGLNNYSAPLPCTLCNGSGRMERRESTSARINSVQLRHNVEQDGQIGVLVLVNCEIAAGRGQKCGAGVYIYETNGRSLPDRDGSFAIGNQVGTNTEMTPGFDQSVWKSLELFLPYSQFDLLNEQRKHLELSVSIKVQNGDWIEIAQSPRQRFWVKP